MTIQDLYRVLTVTQTIEIHKANDTGVMCGKWSGKAKDIPLCYFDSKIISMYTVLYKCNTEFTFIVVNIE